MTSQQAMPDEFTLTIALPGGTVRAEQHDGAWGLTVDGSPVATGRGADALRQSLGDAVRSAAGPLLTAPQRTEPVGVEVSSDLDTQSAARLLDWWEQVFDIEQCCPVIDGTRCVLTVFGIPAPDYWQWPRVAWLDWAINGGGSPAASEGVIRVHQWCGHEAIHDSDYGWAAEDSPDYDNLCSDMEQLQSDPEEWTTEFTDTREPGPGRRGD